MPKQTLSVGSKHALYHNSHKYLANLPVSDILHVPKVDYNYKWFANIILFFYIKGKWNLGWNCTVKNVRRFYGEQLLNYDSKRL